MGRYILRRLVMLVPVLFGVSLVSFSLLHVVPGDPAEVLGGAEATKEDVDRIRREYGLDRPLLVQYLQFAANAARGDFGISIQSRHPVRGLLFQSLGFTLQLSLASILVASVVGLLAGIISATRPYSLFDALGMLGALFGISMPIFWLGLLLIVVFAVQLHWLPSGGTGTLFHLILPAVALGSASSAVIARMTRASMLEVVRQDYIRTARATGYREDVVIFRHALKNAMIPILTVFGLEFGSMLGGAVLTETVFSLPGVGRLLVEGIFARDYPVVQGAMMLVATTFVLVNLLTDAAYAFFDPRIRYE
ncbi:MAG: peptide ABC transporter permease [Candidatus Rokubacteria bacterium RIFCSPLOWO2_02_FULL_68_19]|nr:MAG: peptide ABC transporter permease [Candidatus Rokubacteria bacterium RIFCSPLOWO2_02_FULL_68_19]